VEVFIEEGFHEPVIPLFDVVGNCGGTDPWQSCPGNVKTGFRGAVTIILILATDAH